MPSPVHNLVSLAADVLAWLVGWGWLFARPLVRLWRLACLRSRIVGNVPVTTQFDGRVTAAQGTRLALGDGCRIGHDVFFETQGDGRICVGRHVRINRGCVLAAHAGVVIGDDCLIGEYVSLRDNDHGTEPGQIKRVQPHRAEPIEIGEDVWIGRGAVILKGVRIGRGAIIGANSVVTREVPAWSIAAGSPARVIRSLRPGVEQEQEPAGATRLDRPRFDVTMP